MNDRNNINNPGNYTTFYEYDNDQAGGTTSSESFYNFDSYVDPSMLLPEDLNYGALHSDDFAIIDSIPALPSAIPSASEMPASISVKGPGSLYDKLTTNPSPSPAAAMSPLPNSPSLYPYIGGSPYSMGSPSSLMMSTGDVSGYSDPNWMHSNRPRRRRSTYASPSLMPQNLYQNHYMMGPSSPNQMAMGFNSMNMQYGNPMMSSPMYHNPHLQHPSYMMAPQMSPMNFTVKLPMAPMAPLTPTNYKTSANGSVKIPLVLPCHLQQQQLSNSAAPNVSKLQTNITSAISSGVPSRCSSIAPNSSISSRSSQFQQNWFAEMSLTKDRFLKDVDELELNNVTVVELKQILKKFGLNSTGKKLELVERIKEISGFLKTEGRKRVKVDESESVVSQKSLSAVSAAV